MTTIAGLRHRVGAALAMLFAAGATAVGLAGAASAHDPIILTADQTTPARGPLLVDGTVSFALYGTIEEPGETRAFRVRFATGDTFILSALVPDLAPEKALARQDLPKLQVISPSGETTDLEPGTITTFAEPFSGTNYRRYLEWSAPAEAGDYGVVVTGSVPARFTVSTGVRETFGTAVEDIPNREAGVGGVMEWYATPPPSVPVTATTAPSATSSPPSTAVTTAPGEGSGGAASAAGPADGSEGSGDDSENSAISPLDRIALFMAIGGLLGGAVYALRRAGAAVRARRRA